MRHKITWKMVFDDFRKHQPSLRKEVTHWEPNDFAEIRIYLNDGTELIYNYDTKESKILSVRWK